MYAYLATALVAVAVGFCGGWTAQGWRWEAADGRAATNAQAKARLQRQGAESASQAYEGARERARTEFLTITERVNVEIEKPVYRNVCLPDDGLRELNAAIRTANHSGEPGPAVPAAARTP